jgi:hypothetical protein
MTFLRSLLFAALLFLSSCAQKAEIPEVEYVLAAKLVDFV